jgi:HAD superfamily hydrolase (TIGR01549 family)
VKSVPSDQIELASDRYHEYFARRFTRRTRTYPGVRKLLIFLRQAGVMLGVFTGASRKSAQTALQLSGLELFFHCIVIADDVSQSKPDSEGFQKAMDQLGATDDQTIYVGDDPDDVVAPEEQELRVHFGDQGNVSSSMLLILISYSTILLTSKYYLPVATDLNNTLYLDCSQLINRDVIHSSIAS